MKENKIVLRRVGELVKDNFFVDSYQRGYKWTEKEVEALLRDIEEFSPDANEFYCLQPIVVKEKVWIDSIKEDNKRGWELIDGQQRLTTIFIILSCLGKEKFFIDYRTREASARFLQEQVANQKLTVENWGNFVDHHEELDNIDNYYFFHAYNSIKKWFSEKEDEYREEFYGKLLQQTRVIWYEIRDNITDSREIFARLNSGKIPLTNAELIKALFLQNKSTTINEEVFHQRQTELAQEWDRIECALRNEEFWCFLNKGKNEQSNHIEFVFDLVSEKWGKNGKTTTFDAFYDRLENGKYQEVWNEVKSYFLTLQEWFEDSDLFHYIGYLVCFNFRVHQLYDLSQDKTKNAFKKALEERCLQSIKTPIRELTYEYNREEVKRALLLFNIKTLLENKENFRFPFHKYKKGKWDIEHIHAVKTEEPTSQGHWQQWFEEARSSLILTGIESEKRSKAEDLIKQIESIVLDNKAQLQKLQKEVIDFYSEEEEDIDGIANLALLDAGTNRSYKNAFFPLKRSEIISRDKAGTFIPVCTKNVFLKYYSQDENTHLHYWTRTDKENYLQAIEKSLTPERNK